MPGTVRIAIEIDDRGLIRGFQQVETGLGKVGQRGNVVMTGLANDQRRAQQATQLLSRTLGVQLPRALDNVIARSKLIGPLLSAAFNVAIVAGLATAIIALIPKVVELTDKWAGLTQEVKDSVAAAIEFNRKYLLAIGRKPQQELERLRREQVVLRTEIEALEGPVITLNTLLLGVNSIVALVSIATRLFSNELKAKKAALEQATEAVEFWQERVQASTLTAIEAAHNLKPFVVELDAVAQAARAAAAGLTAMDPEKRPTLFRPEELQAMQEFVLLLQIAEGIAQRRVQAGEQEAALAEDLRRQIEDLEMAQLSGIERVLAERDKELAQIRELMELHQANADLVELLKRKEVLIEEQANRRIAEEQRRRFDEMRDQLAGFLDQVFLSSRSWKETWQQLFQQLKKLFVQFIAELIIAWITGTRSIREIFDSVLGDIFGRGVKVRGTPPIAPGVSIGNFLPGGFAPGFGLGITVPRDTRLPRRAGGGTAIGIAAVAGLGALTFLQQRSGGGGRGRRRGAASSEAELLRQLVQIWEEFRAFQSEFQSALAQFDDLWSAFQANAPRQFGRYGRRAVRNVAPWVGVLRNAMLELNRVREARGLLLGGLPIPEFQRGGLVEQVLSDFRAVHSGSGKLLAFLHRGEAVLNAGAVQRLGPGFVERANRAPGFQTGGFLGGQFAPSGVEGQRPMSVTINIEQRAGESSEELARRVARHFRRWARDQGLPRPV